MNDETKAETPKEAPKPKAKPTRIALEHPKMMGQSLVLEKDIAAWLGKGWQRVKSAGNAE